MTAAVLDWPQATFASKVDCYLFIYFASYHSNEIIKQLLCLKFSVAIETINLYGSWQLKLIIFD